MQYGIETITTELSDHKKDDMAKKCSELSVRCKTLEKRVFELESIIKSSEKWDSVEKRLQALETKTEFYKTIFSEFKPNNI